MPVIDCKIQRRVRALPSLPGHRDELPRAAVESF